MNFGSLFAGIGGLDLGLERAGMTCKWQVENDPYCNRVLAKHWPHVARYGDIREVNTDRLERVDLICGGFPCQDISNAGKRAGIDGERSGLWSEYIRIVRALRPRYVLVENVAALLGRGIERVLGDLAASGYDAEWDCIPAAAVGAPHFRDRVFIVAYSERSWRGQSSVDTQATQRPFRSSVGQEGAPIARSGGQAVADAAGYGVEKQHVSSQRRIRILDPDRRSATDADTDSRNSDRWRCDVQMGRSGVAQTSTGNILRTGDQWRVEPNMGRVAHGVSFGLELFGGRLDEQGDNKETDAKARFACWQVLRSVWEHRELAETSPYLYGERLRDIVPALPCSGGFARWVAQAKSDEELRSLWESFYSLSFEEAYELQQDLLKRAGAEERRQTVAFRKQRVARLRGLGNAVVPQVAEWIGERITEADVSARPEWITSAASEPPPGQSQQAG